MQLNPKALGLTAGVFAGALWFIAMVVSLATGLGQMTLVTLGSYHPWFSYSWVGMVVITIEHLVGGFILGYIFAKAYNAFSK